MPRRKHSANHLSRTHRQTRQAVLRSLGWFVTLRGGLKRAVARNNGYRFAKIGKVATQAIE